MGRVHQRGLIQAENSHQGHGGIQDMVDPRLFPQLQADQCQVSLGAVDSHGPDSGDYPEPDVREREGMQP